MKPSKEQLKEEHAEQVKYRLWMGWLFALMTLPVLTAAWPGYYKFLFYIGAVIYYIGFWKFYPSVYEFGLKDHPMRHSSNYRMTDGHGIAIPAAICWPVLAPLVWAIQKIVRLVQRRRSATTS